MNMQARAGTFVCTTHCSTPITTCTLQGKKQQQQQGGDDPAALAAAQAHLMQSGQMQALLHGSEQDPSMMYMQHMGMPFHPMMLMDPNYRQVMAGLPPGSMPPAVARKEGEAGADASGVDLCLCTSQHTPLPG